MRSNIFGGKRGFTYVEIIGCTECTFGSSTFCITIDYNEDRVVRFLLVGRIGM